MPRLTFTWNPDMGCPVAQKPSVQVTKFGDGYETRVPVGINNNAETWQLKFTMSKVETGLALAFIRACNATESFYWVNPEGLTKIYICREWNAANDTGIRVLSATFEQVFEF